MSKNRLKFKLVEWDGEQAILESDQYLLCPIPISTLRGLRYVLDDIELGLSDMVEQGLPQGIELDHADSDDESVHAFAVLARPHIRVDVTQGDPPEELEVQVDQDWKVVDREYISDLLQRIHSIEMEESR